MIIVVYYNNDNISVVVCFICVHGCIIIIL